MLNQSINQSISLAVWDHAMLLASCNPTQVNKPQPVKAGTLFTYLPQINERLSWPRRLDSAPAGNHTATAWSKVRPQAAVAPKHCLLEFSYYCSSKDRGWWSEFVTNDEIHSRSCPTLSAATVCPSLDTCTTPTPHKNITVLYKPALWVLLMIGDGRVGRPRQSWLRTVEADLRPMNLGLATSKPSDRHGGNS